MATLYVAEFTGTRVQSQSIGVPEYEWPPVNEATITIGASSTVGSLTFGDSTTDILIHADVDCHIEIGLSPVATTNNMKLVSGGYLSAGVTPGHKVAVIES